MFKFAVGFLALCAAAPSALAAITVTGPSSDVYWVANTSNTITWNYAAGDQDPVSIVVTNENGTTLNGAFSIAEYVTLSDKSFTVTNVTLKTGGGYLVNFVNSTDPTQIYAKSSAFEVKPGGTPPHGSSVITVSGSVITSRPATTAATSSVSGAATTAAGAANGALSAYNLPSGGLTSAVGIMSALVGAALCAI